MRRILNDRVLNMVIALFFSRSLCLETSCTADEHFIWKDSFEVYSTTHPIHSFFYDVLQHRFRWSTCRWHFWRLGHPVFQRPNSNGWVSTLFTRSRQSNRGGKLRNLSLTEAEETALVNLFLFVHDLGVPPHLENDAFDTLWEKVSEPSPFDYS